MSTAHNALTQCTAIVVGYDGKSANLVALAQRVGFGSIQELNETPQPKRPEFPIAFFLVNHLIAAETKVHLLNRLRRSPSSKIRFAPIIAIGPDVEFEVVLSHIEMGFDDFITLPDNGAMVQSRLISQLDAPQTYVETADYFGPDRRRMELPGQTHESRKSSPHSHTKLLIQRSVDTGIAILRQEIFA